MSKLSTELCDVYENTLSSARKLARENACVAFGVMIAPHDIDTDDVPHGAVNLSFVTTEHLQSPFSRAWKVCDTPDVKKWFRFGSGHVTVSVVCHIDTLSFTNCLSVFKAKSKAVRLDDPDAVHRAEDRPDFTTVSVFDNDPDSVGWEVSLVWSKDKRCPILEKVVFKHDPVHHPRTMQMLADEATRINMHELREMIPVAQKRLTTKRRRTVED